jgi:hypothetical protein
MLDDSGRWWVDLGVVEDAHPSAASPPAPLDVDRDVDREGDGAAVQLIGAIG